jgi:hypothetical protein
MILTLACPGCREVWEADAAGQELAVSRLRKRRKITRAMIEAASQPRCDVSAMPRTARDNGARLADLTRCPRRLGDGPASA